MIKEPKIQFKSDSAGVQIIEGRAEEAPFGPIETEVARESLSECGCVLQILFIEDQQRRALHVFHFETVRGNTFWLFFRYESLSVFENQADK